MYTTQPHNTPCWTRSPLLSTIALCVASVSRSLVSALTLGRGCCDSYKAICLLSGIIHTYIVCATTHIVRMEAASTTRAPPSPLHSTPLFRHHPNLCPLPAHLPRAPLPQRTHNSCSSRRRGYRRGCFPASLLSPEPFAGSRNSTVARSSVCPQHALHIQKHAHGGSPAHALPTPRTFPNAHTCEPPSAARLLDKRGANSFLGSNIIITYGRILFF